MYLQNLYRKRCVKVALASLMGLVSPFLFSGVSVAERTPWNEYPCSAGYPALFEHDNFDGQHLKLTGRIQNLRTFGWTDRASSLCVPRGWHITVYEHDSYRGAYLFAPPSDYWADLERGGPNRIDWGDRISSVKVSRYNYRSGDWVECLSYGACNW